MDKINFQNLPNTTTPVNATNLNQLQTNVETAMNKIIANLVNVNSTALSVTTGVTTDTTVLETTIAKAGVYLFVATVPINYYGQTGRDLECRLVINNSNVSRCGGIINTSVYTLYSPLIALTGLSANSNVKIVLRDTEGKSYACPQFTLQYLLLKEG